MQCALTFALSFIFLTLGSSVEASTLTRPATHIIRGETKLESIAKLKTGSSRGQESIGLPSGPVRPSITYNLTQTQVAEMFRSSASQIPSQLISLSIFQLGALNLRSLLNDIQFASIEFVAWCESPNGTPSKRYFTRFTHAPDHNKIFVNSKLWFSLSPDQQSEVALNAVLSAFGYNDALYQLTTALWFFSKPELRQGMTNAEFNAAWKLAQTISVRLPDRDESTSAIDPLGTQLPPHYGKITPSSNQIEPFGNLRASGLTIFIPVEMIPQTGGNETLVALTPYIPQTALPSGGGDWGGILMKRSMIFGNYEKQMGPNASIYKGKMLEGFRLAMLMDFEINWFLTEAP